MKVSALFFILLCVLMAVPAFAVVYTWVDDSGVVNFTEDYGSIPQKYRKKARMVGEEPTDEPVTTGTTSSGSNNSTIGQDSSKAVAQPAEAKKTYGGKDEITWRQDFARAKAELQSIRDQIEGVNARLAKSDQISRYEYRSLENTKKLLEEQERIARSKLEALSTEANKAGVPPDLR